MNMTYKKSNTSMPLKDVLNRLNDKKATAENIETILDMLAEFNSDIIAKHDAYAIDKNGYKMDMFGEMIPSEFDEEYFSSLNTFKNFLVFVINYSEYKDVDIHNGLLWEMHELGIDPRNEGFLEAYRDYLKQKRRNDFNMFTVISNARK